MQPAHTSAVRKANIAILLRLSSSPHRDRLIGIFNRIGPSDDWDIRLLANEAELREVLSGNAFPADGIITFMPREEATRRALIASEIPLVALGIDPELERRRQRAICCIHNDNREVGRLASEFFMHQGFFNDFAFVHDRSLRPWSEARKAAFVRALKAEKRTCRICALAPSESEDTAALAEFLGTLSRPAAVLVAHDARAIDVLRAAHAAGLNVPRDISVLGVDDDALLCEHAKPRLSSIKIDGSATGGRAVDELRKLLSARKPPRRQSVSLSTCRGIVQRESTHGLTPASQLLGRARAFISENALRGISPADVARYLGVSRRLLDLRFSQLCDRSVLACINDVRLEESKRLLATTEMSVYLVFEAAGFSDNIYAHHLFKVSTGLTPTEYRRQASQKLT